MRSCGVAFRRKMKEGGDFHLDEETHSIDDVARKINTERGERVPFEHGAYDAELAFTLHPRISIFTSSEGSIDGGKLPLRVAER